ncbi:MAG: DUF3267 domain-containing protein [Anaerolineae bacterium]|nr:DUF3267 domain-containing protein [Anaerolineae bacterium]
MKLHWGNLPDNEMMEIPAGWQQLPTLGARKVQNYGLLASCAGILVVALLLKGDFRPTNLLAALFVLVMTVPVHELIHALSTPRFGMTDQTVFGLQFGKGLLMPYVYYNAPLPLWRLLLVGIMPTILLTIVPLTLLLTGSVNGDLRTTLGFLAFFNIGVSGGDLANFLWFATRLPLHSTVQRNGWGLVWKA